jgi:O-acetyl-ADP-ribose deacetylase (regulator of RNase III)
MEMETDLVAGKVAIVKDEESCPVGIAQEFIETEEDSIVVSRPYGGDKEAAANAGDWEAYAVLVTNEDEPQKDVQKEYRRSPTFFIRAPICLILLVWMVVAVVKQALPGGSWSPWDQIPDVGPFINCWPLLVISAITCLSSLSKADCRRLPSRDYRRPRMRFNWPNAISVASILLDTVQLVSVVLAFGWPVVNQELPGWLTSLVRGFSFASLSSRRLWFWVASPAAFAWLFVVCLPFMASAKAKRDAEAGAAEQTEDDDRTGHNSHLGRLRNSSRPAYLRPTAGLAEGRRSFLLGHGSIASIPLFRHCTMVLGQFCFLSIILILMPYSTPFGGKLMNIGKGILFMEYVVTTQVITAESSLREQPFDSGIDARYPHLVVSGSQLCKMCFCFTMMQAQRNAAYLHLATLVAAVSFFWTLFYGLSMKPKSTAGGGLRCPYYIDWTKLCCVPCVSAGVVGQNFVVLVVSVVASLRRARGITTGNWPRVLLVALVAGLMFTICLVIFVRAEAKRLYKRDLEASGLEKTLKTFNLVDRLFAVHFDGEEPFVSFHQSQSLNKVRTDQQLQRKRWQHHLKQTWYPQQLSHLLLQFERSIGAESYDAQFVVERRLQWRRDVAQATSFSRVNQLAKEVGRALTFGARPGPQFVMLMMQLVNRILSQCHGNAQHHAVLRSILCDQRLTTQHAEIISQSMLTSYHRISDIIVSYIVPLEEFFSATNEAFTSEILVPLPSSPGEVRFNSSTLLQSLDPSFYSPQVSFACHLKGVARSFNDFINPETARSRMPVIGSQRLGLEVVNTFVAPSGVMLVVSKGSVVNFAGDAIVKAANNSCLGGGGEDGAISQSGGPAMHAARSKLPVINSKGHRCATGDAVLTTGGNLQAKKCIHAVGPDYRDHSSKFCAPFCEGRPSISNADKLLASAYRQSVALASESDEVASLAFSLLSAGIFRGPVSLHHVLEIGVRAVITEAKNDKRKNGRNQAPPEGLYVKSSSLAQEAYMKKLGDPKMIDLDAPHPSFGGTLLTWAAEFHRSDLVQELLARGADPLKVSYEGWDALQWATNTPSSNYTFSDRDATIALLDAARLQRTEAVPVRMSGLEEIHFVAVADSEVAALTAALESILGSGSSRRLKEKEEEKEGEEINANEGHFGE